MSVARSAWRGLLCALGLHWKQLRFYKTRTVMSCRDCDWEQVIWRVSWR